ncbi:hypothetical protein OAS76_02625 [Nitrosopumilus sp.]|nr:hypothetical protein [Nitrosopumilus sp.]
MKNKILFWVDVSLLQFGIAKTLKEKTDANLYVIYDLNHHLKKSFMNQNIVNFEKEWYFWDHVGKIKKPNVEYLKKIEEEYKINLWEIAYSERIFYKYNPFYKFNEEEILSIFEQECRLYENVLNEVKPDFLVIKTTDLHRNHLLTEMCRAKGVKILMLFGSRLAYRASISSQSDVIDYDLDEKKENRVKIESPEDLEKYMKSHNRFKQTGNVQSGGMNTPLYKKIIPSITWLTKTFDSKWQEGYDHYGVTRLNAISHYLTYSLKGRLRKRFIDKKFEKNIKTEEKFLFFPLHVQPERNVDIVAPFYANQVEVITNIAKALPADYKLYVKEHYNMFLRHWRETSQYKKIMELPNVKLIHPSVNPKILLEKCAMVITITGTAGFEAALYKKPCIVFADVIYSSLPSVHRLKSLEELPMAIKESLQKEVKLSDVNEFINVLDRNSFEFDIFEYYSKVAKKFHSGGFMISDKISMNYLDSFIEEDREMYEMLADEHIKKIEQHKKIDKKS